MRTAISSAESRGLPAGLRIRRHRGAPIWVVVAGLAGAGLVLGTVLAGAPSTAILGTAALLAVMGAAIYWPALALAILAFTYPFDLITYVGPVKVTSSDALIAVLLLVLVVRQFLPNPPAIRRTSLDIPVLIFTLASLASLMSFTGNLSGQLVGLLKAFGGFVLFFLATQCIRDLRDTLLVIGSIAATALIQATQTIIPFMAGSEGVSIDNRATGTLIDPNLFAGYLVLILPLVIAIGVSFRPWWPVMPTVGATLVLVGALAVTLSRSGWLGAIAGASMLLALLWAQRWKLVAVLAPVGACLLIIGLSGPIAARLAPSDNGPMQMLADREQVWSAAIHMTLDHPIVGVGVDNFQNYYDAYSGNDDALNHAHNLFLNIAAERGLLGLLSFMGVLAFAVGSLRRRFIVSRPGLEGALVVGLAGSLTSYIVHSLFEVSYYDYKVLLLFWLLLAFSAVVPTSNRSDSLDGRKAESTKGSLWHGIAVG